jgi:choline-sulfatase
MIRLCLILLFAAIHGHSAEKPNVLFLFSDDQSYEMIRANGYEGLETPNLDRLAESGTTFTHAYNMGSWSGAVCVASRAMLITGRSVWRAQELDGKMNQQVKARRLWPQRMADSGYETYFTGKWHIRADATQVFHHTANIRGGMPKDGNRGYNRPLIGEPDPWSPYDRSNGGFWSGGKHWSEVVADDAIGFLEAARGLVKPFFMYVAFNAPHDPRQSPKEYVDKYPLDEVAVPRNFLPTYPYQNEIGCGAGLRDEKLAPFPRHERAVKVHRQEYQAIVSHLDAQIGRILDALEKSGKAGNTWIIFTSDHGLACGHHGLMGKQNMYDHSLRVPFIVKGPGVKAGERCASPIYLQDAMATALDLAGAGADDGLEFKSLLPALRNEGEVGREEIYGAYLNLQRAVIHDGWKLIVYPKAKVVRLYHLSEDPLEMKDLAKDEALAERRKSLMKRLVSLQKAMDDRLDLSGFN